MAGIVVVAALLALAGCGGDDGGDSTSTADLAEVMVDTGASEEEATCVAEKLDGVSASELGDFMSDVESGERVEATSGVAEQFINARALCNLDE